MTANKGTITTFYTTQVQLRCKDPFTKTYKQFTFYTTQVQLRSSEGRETGALSKTFYTTQVQLRFCFVWVVIKGSYTFLYHLGAIEVLTPEIIRHCDNCFLYHLGAIEVTDLIVMPAFVLHFLYHLGAIEVMMEQATTVEMQTFYTTQVQLRCQYFATHLFLE